MMKDDILDIDKVISYSFLICGGILMLVACCLGLYIRVEYVTVVGTEWIWKPEIFWPLWNKFNPYLGAALFIGASCVFLGFKWEEVSSKFIKK